MKRHIFIASLVAFTVGHIHAAEVIERSKDNRRFSNLHAINRGGSANTQGKVIQNSQQPQSGQVNRKK